MLSRAGGCGSGSEVSTEGPIHATSEPFWLARVVQKHDQLKVGKSFDDWGVKLECKKGESAVVVVKLMPSRPESTNKFCEHNAQRHVHVPLKLLRVPDLVGSGRMTRVQRQVRNTRSRSTARPAAGDTSGQYYVYELKSEARQHVVLRCRALDNIAS